MGYKLALEFGILFAQELGLTSTCSAIIYRSRFIVQSTIVLYEDTKYSVYPSFSYNFSD